MMKIRANVSSNLCKRNGCVVEIHFCIVDQYLVLNVINIIIVVRALISTRNF